MGWLREQPPKLRKDGTPRKPRRSGDPNRTYFNKVNNVVIFLSAHGINRLLKKSEYPKFAEKPVVYYEAAQVKALYAAASNDDERFTLDYFLKSGVRDGEAAHAEYRRREGWFPKHRGQATPEMAPQALAYPSYPDSARPCRSDCGAPEEKSRLQADLPEWCGNPDEHLLRIVQRIARTCGWYVPRRPAHIPADIRDAIFRHDEDSDDPVLARSQRHQDDDALSRDR